jgi:hypothetical protein
MRLLKTPFLHTILPLLLAIFVVSCKKTTVQSSNELDGKWIEVANRKDTLLFDSKTSFVTVKRGLEKINGLTIPKAGSGIYRYSINGYQMSIQNLLLSSINSTKHHIELKKGVLYLGNFYEVEAKQTEIRAFDKL